MPNLIASPGEALCEARCHSSIFDVKSKHMKILVVEFYPGLIIGFLLVLPFMVLEFLTRNPALPRSNFPFTLFIAMWVAAVVFIYLLTQIVRDLRAGKSISANPVIFFLKTGFLIALSWNWVGLVIDQWPCFLGATGC